MAAIVRRPIHPKDGSPASRKREFGQNIVLVLFPAKRIRQAWQKFLLNSPFFSKKIKKTHGRGLVNNEDLAHVFPRFPADFLPAARFRRLTEFE
jgi:hypothetical protein